MCKQGKKGDRAEAHLVPSEGKVEIGGVVSQQEARVVDAAGATTATDAVAAPPPPTLRPACFHGDSHLASLPVSSHS